MLKLKHLNKMENLDKIVIQLREYMQTEYRNIFVLLQEEREHNKNLEK